MAKSMKSKAKRTLKKTHFGYIIIAVLALVAGLAAGYFGASFYCGSDTLELVGAKETEVEVGQSVSYTDEGIKYISLRKNLSDKYTVKTNMTLGDDGKYTGVPTEETELYIIYTVTEGRCKGMTLYRTFSVKGVQ